MPSRPNKPRSLSTVENESILPGPSVPYEQIAARAYDLYLNRGAIDGYDVEDWLQAEQELLREASVAAA